MANVALDFEPGFTDVKFRNLDDEAVSHCIEDYNPLVLYLHSFYMM